MPTRAGWPIMTKPREFTHNASSANAFTGIKLERRTIAGAASKPTTPLINVRRVSSMNYLYITRIKESTAGL